MFQTSPVKTVYLHTCSEAEIKEGSGSEPTHAGTAGADEPAGNRTRHRRADDSSRDHCVCVCSVQSGVQQDAVSARRFRFLHLTDGPLKVGLLDGTNEVF